MTRQRFGLTGALTTSDAARELETTPRRVRQLIDELGINALKIGNKLLVISEADLAKMRARKTQRGPAAKKGKK